MKPPQDAPKIHQAAYPDHTYFLRGQRPEGTSGELSQVERRVPSGVIRCGPVLRCPVIAHRFQRLMLALASEIEHALWAENAVRMGRCC